MNHPLQLARLMTVLSNAKMFLRYPCNPLPKSVVSALRYVLTADAAALKGADLSTSVIAMNHPLQLARLMTVLSNAKMFLRYPCNPLPKSVVSALRYVLTADAAALKGADLSTSVIAMNHPLQLARLMTVLSNAKVFLRYPCNPLPKSVVSALRYVLTADAAALKGADLSTSVIAMNHPLQLARLMTVLSNAKVFLRYPCNPLPKSVVRLLGSRTQVAKSIAPAKLIPSAIINVVS